MFEIVATMEAGEVQGNLEMERVYVLKVELWELAIGGMWETGVGDIRNESQASSLSPGNHEEPLMRMGTIGAGVRAKVDFNFGCVKFKVLLGCSSGEAEHMVG